MTEIITYLLIAIVFALVGVFIGKLLSKLNFEKEKTLLEKEKSTLEERVTLLQQSKDITENNFIESQKELKIKAKVDWKKFNKDSQKAIKEREIQIEELRARILEINKEEIQKFTLALDTLEQKKNSLKERLAQIDKKLKTNMEHINESDEILKTAFERAFVHDMNELTAGIRDFWKTNSINK